MEKMPQNFEGQNEIIPNQNEELTPTEKYQLHRKESVGKAMDEIIVEENINKQKAEIESDIEKTLEEEHRLEDEKILKEKIENEKKIYSSKTKKPKSKLEKLAKAVVLSALTMFGSGVITKSSAAGKNAEGLIVQEPVEPNKKPTKPTLQATPTSLDEKLTAVAAQRLEKEGEKEAKDKIVKEEKAKNKAKDVISSANKEIEKNKELPADVVKKVKEGISDLEKAIDGTNISLIKSRTKELSDEIKILNKAVKAQKGEIEQQQEAKIRAEKARHKADPWAERDAAWAPGIEADFENGEPKIYFENNSQEKNGQEDKVIIKKGIARRGPRGEILADRNGNPIIGRYVSVKGGVIHPGEIKGFPHEGNGVIFRAETKNMSRTFYFKDNGPHAYVFNGGTILREIPPQNLHLLQRVAVREGRRSATSKPNEKEINKTMDIQASEEKVTEQEPVEVTTPEMSTSTFTTQQQTNDAIIFSSGVNNSAEAPKNVEKQNENKLEQGAEVDKTIKLNLDKINASIIFKLNENKQIVDSNLKYDLGYSDERNSVALLNEGYYNIISQSKKIDDPAKASDKAEKLARDIYVEIRFFEKLAKENKENGPEATYLRRKITNAIIDAKDVYGDIFEKDIQNFKNLNMFLKEKQNRKNKIE